jgi:hypothetical protein
LKEAYPKYHHEGSQEYLQHTKEDKTVQKLHTSEEKSVQELRQVPGGLCAFAATTQIQQYICFLLQGVYRRCFWRGCTCGPRQKNVSEGFVASRLRYVLALTFFLAQAHRRTSPEK